MTHTIRPVTHADADALAHIIVTATQHTFTGLLPLPHLTWLSAEQRAAAIAAAQAASRDVQAALVAAEEAQSAANWRASFAHDADPTAIFLGAEAAGVLVGYALAYELAGQTGDDHAGHPAGGLAYGAELGMLYVLPSHHRLGIGRALVSAVAEQLAQRSVSSLRVGVVRVSPNRGFYARLGAQYLYDRTFTAGDSTVPECVYGWPDTRMLIGVA